MAVVRQGRNSPPYALISFVFLWVLAMAGLVIFYIAWGKANQATLQAKQQLAQIASFRDQQNPTIRDMLANATGTKTVIHQLQREIANLKFSIAGAQHAGAVKVAALTGSNGEIATTLGTAGMAGKSLLAAVASLKTQLDQAQALQAQYKKAWRNYEHQFTDAQSTFHSNSDAMNQKLAAARKRIDSLTAKLDAAKTSLASQATTFQTQISGQQQKFAGDLRKQFVAKQQYQQEVVARNLTIKNLQHQIQGLRAPTQGANAILSQADGKILRVSAVDNLAYLNIGANDHLSVGQTFAVYSPQLGVGSGTNSGGKGSIVVTKVGPYASVARITHVATNQALFPGDLIANPVFSSDLNRKYHFVVSGDFDLNGNGVPTAQGRRQIISLIKQWGGVIDKKLTSQTDFLVLGSPPAKASLSFGAASQAPVSTAVAGLQTQAQINYDTLQATAQGFSVPILDANRFLAMIGYYTHPLIHQ